MSDLLKIIDKRNNETALANTKASYGDLFDKHGLTPIACDSRHVIVSRRLYGYRCMVSLLVLDRAYFPEHVIEEAARICDEEDRLVTV